MSSTSPTASPCEELIDKVGKRTAKVGIVGMGYVGLPLALLYSEQRFAVTGFDIDQPKVTALNRGESYIVRILADDIQSAQKSGFRATTAYSEVSDMDAIIICVPTPLNEHHEPDMTYIVSTVEAIAPYVRAGQLVVLESTTYPGTTEEVVIPLLENGNRQELKVVRGEDEDGLFVAFSPEREDPGNDTVARRDIPKVIGGVSPGATRDGSQALWQHLPPGRSSIVTGHR